MSENLPAVVSSLLNPASGELLPATPENAALVLAALRDLRQRINDAVADCQDVLVAESQRVGTKTLHIGGLVATVTGGSETLWDVERLREGLRSAGCPEERLDALITAHVEYKVNQSVARQLSSANPKYATAIEVAKTRVEKSLRVSVKQGT